MANLNVERIALSDPEVWNEAVGQPVANQGGATVPAIRTALRHAVTLPTIAADGATDTLAARLSIRRRLRALIQNLPYKLEGAYLTWAADSENSGAYVPDQGQFVSGVDQAGLATGWFKADSLVWQLLARLRTHRRAVSCYLKQRNVSSMWRDYYKGVFSSDFSGLTALNVTWLPAAVTDALNVDSAAPVTVYPAASASQDGSTVYFAVGLTDLARVSFEQPEANVNSSDVIVYDRRGTITAPSTGPDAAWEQTFGPDYPWSSGDVPVLDNGRCRVRYDSSNTPGFKVDAWTGSAWAEQGKVLVQRQGDSTGFLDTLVSAVCLEYTPDRAVVEAVMRRAADSLSRERVILTLQRGWAGPRVEYYTAPKQATPVADGAIFFYTGAADTNDSATKLDAASAVTVATAGSGSALFSTSLVGAATFPNENWVALLRQGQSYAVTLAVLQSRVMAQVGSDSTGYGSARNWLSVTSSGGQNYVSAHFGFHAQQADQVLEAESMTLGSGTASAADAQASAGNTTTATRTSDANAHVTRANWPNAAKAKYRARARVLAPAASTLSLYAKTGAQTGATKTTTATAYTWVDLGDVLSDGTSLLELHAWLSAGSGTFKVDRVEFDKVEDRTATSPVYDGARDAGQASLVDSRSRRRWVTRS